jgi:hypothetical protein
VWYCSRAGKNLFKEGLMRSLTSVIATASVTALLAMGLAASEATAGNGHGRNLNGRPSKDRTTLAPPDGAADTNAIARLDVKHFPANYYRPERSWFRMKARHLDASTEFTLWADDPSTPETDLVQFDSFTTADDGKFNYTKDTKRGDGLPFGATLADLSGKAIEVRDAAGTTTVLVGTIPSTSP